MIFKPIRIVDSPCLLGDAPLLSTLFEVDLVLCLENTLEKNCDLLHYKGNEHHNQSELPLMYFIKWKKRPKKLNYVGVKSTVYMKVFALVCLWFLPLAWIIAYPFRDNNWQGEERTEAILIQVKELVNTFIKEEKVAPLDFNMLRAYAKSKGLSFSLYDGFGHRLEFVRLSDFHFIVRSFGKDGVQNTRFKRTDQITGTLVSRPPQGYVYPYLDAATPKSYDCTALMGSDSPNKRWYAQVYIDRLTHKKYLTVRHRENASLYMLAAHDNVEEFIWLPNSSKIVFTATSSYRYSDGIFLWDILKDESFNLIDLLDEKEKNAAHWGKGSKGLHISLAGVIREGPSVLAYIADNNDQPIAPQDFYAPKNLISIRIRASKDNIKKELLDFQSPGLQASPLNKDFWGLGYELSLLGNKGTVVQQSWRALPLRGDVESVILQWQSFANKRSDTALFPYVTWYLALLYNDASRGLMEKDPKASESLRAFGAEVSKALGELPTAPSYLRAMSAYMYFGFLNKQDMPYTIADLNF